jgi:hypothetical protein
MPPWRAGMPVSALVFQEQHLQPQPQQGPQLGRWCCWAPAAVNCQPILGYHHPTAAFRAAPRAAEGVPEPLTAFLLNRRLAVQCQRCTARTLLCRPGPGCFQQQPQVLQSMAPPPLSPDCHQRRRGPWVPKPCFPALAAAGTTLSRPPMIQTLTLEESLERAAPPCCPHHPRLLQPLLLLRGAAVQLWSSLSLSRRP